MIENLHIKSLKRLLFNHFPKSSIEVFVNDLNADSGLSSILKSNGRLGQNSSVNMPLKDSYNKSFFDNNFCIANFSNGLVEIKFKIIDQKTVSLLDFDVNNDHKTHLHKGVGSLAFKNFILAMNSAGVEEIICTARGNGTNFFSKIEAEITPQSLDANRSQLLKLAKDLDIFSKVSYEDFNGLKSPENFTYFTNFLRENGLQNHLNQFTWDCKINLLDQKQKSALAKALNLSHEKLIHVKEHINEYLHENDKFHKNNVYGLGI